MGLIITTIDFLVDNPVSFPCPVLTLVPQPCLEMVARISASSATNEYIMQGLYYPKMSFGTIGDSDP